MSLRNVQFTKDDYDVLNTGMEKCSRWMTGHATPPMEQATFPKPDELEVDLTNLKNFVKLLDSRLNPKK
jgi:hypothetical protein